MRILKYMGGICLCLFLTACEEDFSPTFQPVSIPEYFPDRLNIPEDNPQTKEGIALGRCLFYEGSLSGRTHSDSLMSCGSCHLQSHAFEAGRDNPRCKEGRMQGLRGSLTPHSMLPLVNLVFQSKGYTWNASVAPERGKNLEDIVKATLTDPNEMAGNLARIEAVISQNPFYPPMFKQAFGTEEVTVERIAKAISQFVRTLVSADSKFDRYLRGETELTEMEMKGYVLFTTEEGADCFHCHGGSGNPLFSTYDCVNNALDSPEHYTDSLDRYSVTGLEKDRGVYRIPTLRNIEYTAPYMHDGRFPTLDAVIDHYSENLVNSAGVSPLMHHVRDGGVQLTANEKACLKAFLLTLSDPEFITNPDFSNPHQ